jgi:hypothetical protein
MLHLVEIMATDDEFPYTVLSYVVDIEPITDELAHQQLQWRLDALLADAPFNVVPDPTSSVRELYTIVSPIDAIPAEADKDTLANNIVDAALVKLEQDGIILKKPEV